MTPRRSDILLHPVRLRIVLSTAGDDVTTADIAKRLPDVPQATLYRHIAALVDAGMLDIVDTRQARGATERTYRVSPSQTSIGVDDAGEMSKDEHLRAFTIFAGILIDTYGRYLDTEDSDPAADGVSFRQIRLWLTEVELAELVSSVTDALAPFATLERTPHRTARLLSTILMPEPGQTND
jgi:DNA-binding transcriptional ArsR family regulator